MTRILCVFLLVLSATASAQNDRGAELYQRCIQCHGVDGLGDKTQEAPRISGQHDWYILSSLLDFKNRVRDNPKMYPFIKDLTEEDFKILASYVSQMKPAESAPAPSDDETNQE